MKTNDGFNSTQLQQLQELFGLQDKRIDAKFDAQDKTNDKKFLSQRQWFEVRFTEERKYYRQLIRDELRDIKESLERLEERLENDAKDTLREVESLKKRVRVLEATVAKLTTA